MFKNSLSLLVIGVRSFPSAGLCHLTPGFQNGPHGCECIAQWATVDLQNDNTCTCEGTYIPGMDASFTLKLSGDNRVCGILPFSREECMAELYDRTKIELGSVRRIYRQSRTGIKTEQRPRNREQAIRRKCSKTTKYLGKLYLKRKRYLIRSYRVAFTRVSNELLTNLNKSFTRKSK